MKVIFAKHIGFCSGVKRAITIAEKSLEEDPKPIQFLGPLVHNEKIIEKLKKQGGKFISNLKEISSGTLILRAHGEILDSTKIGKKILIRDTTCPLVKRVQRTANFLFKQGYRVIIIGDKNHPETKGIKECVKNRAIIIENDFQAKNLPKLKKIGVVSQTTQNLNKVNQILTILKNKVKEFKWVNTICPEVIFRQKELSEILKKADRTLVIGSRSSANTRRLVEIAKKSKKPAWWINSLEELKKINLKGISSLGVISGTSMPDREIQKIRKYLKKAKRNSSVESKTRRKKKNFSSHSSSLSLS
jgi:4-hydroxy-3-methylbut-2-enyl diphosphate reductase